ncbi:MAG: ABC transporter ATP-binding protein [Armatimonadota bacterium]|nr:ABC transporter ATP-binding protein [Armatimonadota bacterium]MDR7448820.1 ABC transporter ATP-binding protein [Armatimonadota bacterium]MDR7459941.1 ABC transporter ATP-binding protein [Armatimonadota bacterium]MDR7479610.1 ABC transporter ATP-binding protein [Armatimonadota bacterium]MDR7488569.1 ABC transporter ATP-binding protein [Armatimonadota bacterium]
MATPLLTVAELHAWYGPVHALRGVALAVHPGECVAIIGPNGAGKTTLLHALTGLVQARGRVELDGRPVLGLPPEALVARGMVLVPERRQLFTTLSVRDNLLLGAYHRARRDPVAIAGDLEEVLRLFPVLRDRQRAPARALSGGMQQMVAVGRGLMGRPRVLLMDEPLLGLAPLVIREILRVLRSLVDRGLALLLVEQNARAALEVAHRAYVMEGGRMVLEGPAAALAEDPRVRAAYLGGHVA